MPLVWVEIRKNGTYSRHLTADNYEFHGCYPAESGPLVYHHTVYGIRCDNPITDSFLYPTDVMLGGADSVGEGLVGIDSTWTSLIYFDGWNRRETRLQVPFSGYTFDSVAGRLRGTQMELAILACSNQCPLGEILWLTGNPERSPVFELVDRLPLAIATAPRPGVTFVPGTNKLWLGAIVEQHIRFGEIDLDARSFSVPDKPSLSDAHDYYYPSFSNDGKLLAYIQTPRRKRGGSVIIQDVETEQIIYRSTHGSVDYGGEIGWSGRTLVYREMSTNEIRDCQTVDECPPWLIDRCYQVLLPMLGQAVRRFMEKK